MANLVTVEANALLASSVKGTAYVAPTTPVKMRLVTVIGTASAAGTEVTNAGGSTYAAQQIDTAMGTAASGSLTNSVAAVTYTNMPGSTTVVGVDVFDSAGTPIRRWWGALAANKTTNLGDTLSFATSTITFTLS